ncbi:hypothetical protein [Bartonella massiliensis]|uniref:hypothetical protein n=1 Tax=Bartonella massiliensis TaxID=929795 RepID=UPI001FE97743|nr:hypothetical protein [Bartonella massiliensis]
MSDTIFVIGGIFILGIILYYIWKAMKKGCHAGFEDTALFVIIVGGLWYFGASTNILLSVVIIAYLVESIMLVVVKNHNKRLNERLKEIEKVND